MNINRLRIISNSWIYLIIVVLLVGIIIFIFVKSKNTEPIRIGFSAQLTGRQAELGVQERNGVQLAVEKINASGGISGRQIELIIRDDLGTPEKAQLVDDELIKEDVVAIIGHATTEQTLSGLKVTNPTNVVMISPTVSTPKLSGLDDYFFSVYPSFKDSSKAFAKYIHQRNAITKMAIIYDKDNFSYSKLYSTTFIDKFKSLGGNITDEVSFSSRTQPDFSSLLLKLREAKPEGVLIIASDMDTALIAQKIRLMEWNIPLFTSAWAQTETLVNNGGKAVEGMQLEQSYPLNSKLSTFTDFQSQYKTRFGNAPSFGSAFSYETALILAEALKKTGGKSNELKHALLEIHDFNGVMDDFSFNAFGDVDRPFYISTIHKGQIIIFDKLTPTKSGGD